LWNQIHPKQRLPQYVTKLGNCANDDQVEVFGFAEDHTDPGFRKYIGEVINRNYRPGDMILIEDVHHQKSKAKDNELTKYVNPEFDVWGWEPPGELVSNKAGFYQKTAEKLKVTEEFVNEISALLDTDKKCTPAEYAVIEQKVHIFQDKIPALVSFFYESEERANEIKQINSLLDLFLSKLNKNEISPPKAAYGFCEVINKHIEERANTMQYKHTSSDDGRILLAANPSRNQSIIGLVQQYRQEGKRVFIIGGANHLLGTGAWDASAVQKELSNHQFQIHVTEKLFSPKYKRGNRHLQLIDA
jgi:hypothetical protein